MGPHPTVPSSHPSHRAAATAPLDDWPSRSIVCVVRRYLALLLLLAAAIHPLVHFADDASACPCVHGAVVDVAPPAFSDRVASSSAHLPPSQAYIPVAAATELPARAPPAA